MKDIHTMNSIFIFVLILFIIATSELLAHAQATVQQDITNLQQDVANQNNNIAGWNAQIATDQANILTAQANIATDNTNITTDTAINNAYQAANAQTTAAWNFTQDAALEASGCRWATCFPVVFPNANLNAIAAQINITCPVTEAQVNWANWPAYSGIHGSTAVTWAAFYCADGPAS